MIGSQDLIQLGFEITSDSISLYDGDYTDFYKKIDNGHIIEGHDTTEIFILKEYNNFIIEIKHQSSHYEGKKLVFQGKITSIEFLEQLLKAVI